MFIDSARFSVSSGKGGQGCASFRREKFVVQGGPDGGDGGKGGDVYFVVDSNTDTLSFYKGKRVFKADKGQPGMGRQKTGKSGEHLILTVPPGTQIIDDDTNEVLYDLLEDGEKFLFIEGGKGGLGNVHFKNSRNQRPTYFQPGLPGITKNIRLELKLIADVGLVGYPNVGKSTLISVTSNATPEIANYEFTTLTPKLGVVNVGDYSSFVMADIPGIIDGASEGKGLGLEFLKHIERTKTLLFTIDVANHRTMIDQYNVLKEELFKFSQELSQRDFAIVLSKIDAFYGQDYIVYGVIYDIFGSFLLLVSVGMIIITWGSGRKNSILNISKSIFLFPPMIIFFITIFAKNFEVPRFLIYTSQNLGSTLVPIAMIAIGMKLELKHIFSRLHIVTVAVVLKMLIVPIIILFIFKYFYGVDETWVKVTLIEVAMPPMTMAAVLAIKGGLDEKIAINSLVLGVIVSLFTITLFTSYLA